MHEIDRELIKQAVAETLSGLGFDVCEAKSLQADMYYLRRLRMGAEETVKTVRHTVIGIVISTLLYVLWDAFRRLV